MPHETPGNIKVSDTPFIEQPFCGHPFGGNTCRELESIARISKITLAGTPEEIAQTTVVEAVTVTGCDQATLWMVDNHSTELRHFAVHHHDGPTELSEHHSLPLDATNHVGYAASTQQIVHTQAGSTNHISDQSAKSDVAVAASLCEQISIEIMQRELEAQRLVGGLATRSLLCIPLTVHQERRVIGVLELMSLMRDGITHQHRQFLERLVPHAAIALHNARLRAIRQQVIRFQQNISDVLPLDQQLDQILDHLREQVDISGLFLAMYHAEFDEIAFLLAFERGKSLDAQFQQAGTRYGPQSAGQHHYGYIEWVLHHRQPLLVQTSNGWPEHNRIDQKVKQGIKSCVVVPLIRQEQIVGAIGLRSYDSSPGTFDEYDQLFLEGIADQIAIILRNSQHYDSTQQILETTNQQLVEQVRALQAVSEFQRRISNIEEEAKEIQNIYTTAREAMEGVGLDVSNMYVALYEADAQKISFPLAYEQGQLIEETVKQGNALYSRTTFGEHRSVAEWIMQRWQSEKKRNALLIESNFDEWVQAHGIRSFSTGTKSWLGAPMVYNDLLIGMIGLRNADREHAFKPEHTGLLETIAGQAAIALDNARLYETEVRNARYFRALHEAGKAITRAGVELDDVLQAILDQAVGVTGSFFGTMQLVKDNHLEFVAAWPKASEDELKRCFGQMPLEGKGVTVRAARLNDAQLIRDVHLDPDYIDATGETGSAIAVVLRRHGEDGKQPVGVLNVEHRNVGGLTMRERSVLIGLANLAAVAVENAQTADQLSRTNAVAVMGAWGADIVHDIHREVSVIRLTLDTLRSEPDLSREILLQRIDEIDEYIKNLIMPPLPEPLINASQSLAERDVVPLDRVIEAEIAAMQRRHGGVTFVWLPGCSDIPGCTETEVQIHEQWLRRLLRHLVVNSVVANRDQAALTITMGTSTQGERAEVWVEDNGRGIRPEIANYLFYRPVPHTGIRHEERHGRGLLLVRHIAEMHNGHAWLKWNHVGKGVCIAFTIPTVN